MTAESIDRTPVDRTGWGPGPWDGEPDRIEWEHAGRPCLMVRHPNGHWCGYAAVDPGHPLHGKDYDDPFQWEDDWESAPHGGLTYANKCGHNVCHVPKPGQPDDVWWFGFDCGHLSDLSPGRAARERAMGFPPIGRHIYRCVPYVEVETNRLAEYLAGVSP